MTLTTGVLVGIGTILVLYGVIKKPPRKPLKRNEVNALYDARVKYLPQLKQLIGDYINRVEILARTDDRVLDLEHYKKVYTTTKLFKRLSRGDETGALLGALYKQQVWKDNLIFREIADEDNMLINISANIDNLATNVKDTQVRNYVNGFRKGAHIAYSYVILNKLSRICEGGAGVPPFLVPLTMLLKFHYHQERKMLNAFRKHQNKINMRIDELLEGVEDG